MKTIIKLLFVATFLFCTTQAYSVHTVLKTNSMDISTMSVGDFMDLKYKDLKEVSQEKLNLKDRIEFMATKRYMKYQLKSENIAEEDDFLNAAGGFNFRFGPFIVGFIFGILGLLIVALVVKKPKKNAVVSALIGFLINSAIWGSFLF